MGKLLKDPKQRRKVIAGGAVVGALILLLVLHKKSTPASEETTATTGTAAPGAIPAGGEPASGGGGSAGGSTSATEALGNTIGSALQTQSAEMDQAIAGLSAQIAVLSQGYEQNRQMAEQSTPAETGSTGPASTPLASSNRASKKKTNLEKGNPRYGMTYTTEPAKGGVVHVYGNGQRIFVPTSRSPSQPPRVAEQHPQPQSQSGNQTHVNHEPGNPRRGQHYRVQKAKGGEWHIYSNGHKVFVRK